jgi:hypothetical protein
MQGALKLESEPAFKYNIFRCFRCLSCRSENDMMGCLKSLDVHSSQYQDFLFEQPVSPSNITIKVEVLKWDTLELRLYQVDSLDLSRVKNNNTRLRMSRLAFPA